MGAKLSVLDRAPIPTTSSVGSATRKSRPKKVAQVLPVSAEEMARFDEHEVQGRAASAAGGALKELDWAAVEEAEEAIRIRHSKGDGA